ncbi:hypothetical protein [Chryseobacterium sp. LAM-KRS1]|uniref:hypothetical protein n=1 Tax=Chryseobacterium sp. LAM-KRS1 TaxID=2715754 RepID=UPI0015565AB2|nr:hypothetical protein [Chryseobacterium sp. LAM-KRS1]
MKKIIYTLITTFIGVSFNAQVLSNGAITNQYPNENIFLDASTNNNSTLNDGKGLLFPSTDLTIFTFKTESLDGINFPSAYDGMVVYNTATGNTVAGNGVVTAVTPGFYYFFNPGQSTDISAGKWLPMSEKTNITTSETPTRTSINNSQVYAVKGTFAATGTSTAVNIPSPDGMKSIYGITIYKSGSGVVYSRDLYSYTLGKAEGNAVTGSQSMSVVYPAGTYDYVLEYLK